jgi:diguanylate cyclase (GGDEF)-like protein
MVDHQAELLQVAELFKVLFAQMQKLAQEANHPDILAKIASDTQLTELERHVFYELIQNKPAQSSYFRDELTGLLVRSHLIERLDCALEGQYCKNSILAVCFVDLDGFKEINDQYGHTVGDQVLGLVGGRLQNSIRSEDLVCRWGGDEFVVVLQNIDRPESIEGLANRLLCTISDPLRVSFNEPLTLFLGASIGVSVVSPLNLNVAQNKVNALTIIEKADQAMYNAKRMGKNRIEIAA